MCSMLAVSSRRLFIEKCVALKLQFGTDRITNGLPMNVSKSPEASFHKRLKATMCQTSLRNIWILSLSWLLLKCISALKNQFIS